MFVQVIQGKTHDAAGLKKAQDEWASDLAPGATGWLGATSGVASDSTFIAIERFASPEAARRNSDRPEQGAWWERTSRLFDGEATFHDCNTALAVRDGVRDDAGFVQVIQGRTKDVDRMIGLGEQMETHYPQLRPDLLGMLFALHNSGDGTFTQVAYFSTEAEARRGESAPIPPGSEDFQVQYMSTLLDVRYFDLTEPWAFRPL